MSYGIPFKMKTITFFSFLFFSKGDNSIQLSRVCNMASTIAGAQQLLRSLPRVAVNNLNSIQLKIRVTHFKVNFAFSIAKQSYKCYGYCNKCC